MSKTEALSPSASALSVEPPPTEPNAVVRGRVLQLDGLRAIAFTAVFLNHAGHIPMLWAGVDVFFVLSGFLITGILLERKRRGGPYFRYFYRRRVFRILPPYLLTVVLYGLLFSWAQYRPVWLFVLAPNVQGLRPHTAGLLPLWSLAVEEQFYFLWPFAVLWTSERVLLWISVAALVLTPIARAVCTPLFPNHFYIYVLTPFRADLLCAGALLAMLWKREELRAPIRRWAPALCVVGFALFLGTQGDPAFRLARNTPLANASVYLFSLVGAAGLVAWTLSSTGWLRSLLSATPLRYLGEISYTMYLVHVVIGVLIEQRLGLHVWVRAVVYAGVVLYATVSWFVMERPLIRLAARAPARAAV